MNYFQTFLCSIGTFLFTAIGTAQTTFTFHDGSGLGNSGTAFNAKQDSFDHTTNGVTLTAQAYLDGTSAGTQFYGTPSGSFGIDNPNTEASDLDDGDRFDNLGGHETMVFSFNVAGTFQSIDLRFIEHATDEAQLIFDGGPIYELNTSTDTGGTEDRFTINQAFTAGQQITLALSANAGANENFSLESFTILPEPTTYTLIAGISALSMTLCRRRS